MKGALRCLDWPAWGSEGSLSVPVACDIVPVVESGRRTATRSWVDRDDSLPIGGLAAHPRLFSAGPREIVDRCVHLRIPVLEGFGPLRGAGQRARPIASRLGLGGAVGGSRGLLAGETTLVGSRPPMASRRCPAGRRTRWAS